MTMKCRPISKVLGASNKILGVEEPWDGGLSDKYDFYWNEDEELPNEMHHIQLRDI